MLRINFHNPGGVFDGILWSEGKIAARGKEKTAAVDFRLFMLGELDGGEERKLLLKLRKITRNADYRLAHKV